MIETDRYRGYRRYSRRAPLVCLMALALCQGVTFRATVPAVLVPVTVMDASLTARAMPKSVTFTS